MNIAGVLIFHFLLVISFNSSLTVALAFVS